MKILAVSDRVVDWIYSPRMRLKFFDVDLAIGCGDLPRDYLEFIVSSLNVPAYFVHGNHSLPDSMPQPHDFNYRGSIDLHRKVLRFKGFTFAGIEGSLLYSRGIYQYSQTDLWLNVLSLVPSLLRNRINFGKYLNVLVTHAPAWGLHDQSDLPHRGIKAFRWLLERFQPDVHLHGHIHIYRPDTVTESQFGQTRVINAYGYKVLNL